MSLVSALLATTLAFPSADTVKTGEDLIRAMHAKYTGKWYRTLSFVQRVIWADGRPEEEWWEAMHSPGRLRIDIAPVDSGNSIVYRADSLFRFTKRNLATSGPGQNMLLVLGFDVYNQPPDRTIALAKSEKVDLSKLRLDQYDGRSMYVVGAAAGDLKSAQFWVDKDRLLFVRWVVAAPNGVVSDIRFENYQALGGGWIAPLVVFVRDGKEVMREVYRDMKANPPAIADDLFSVPPWKRAGWVK